MFARSPQCRLGLLFAFVSASALAQTPLVTGYTASATIRNNYSGWVGMKFTTSGAPLVVTDLGRLYLSGNTGTHAVKLVRATDGVDVPGTTVNVAMGGGLSGQFTWGTLASPVTLAAHSSYYLASLEVSGGDQWYDSAAVTTTSAVTVNNSVFGGLPLWFTFGAGVVSYVPVNLRYIASSGDITPPTVTITYPANGSTSLYNSVNTVTATATASDDVGVVGVQFRLDGIDAGAEAVAAPYSAAIGPLYSNGVHTLQATARDAAGNTATASSVFTVNYDFHNEKFEEARGYLNSAPVDAPLRNNYSGWVGFKFTVGPAPIHVWRLGRYYVSGNTHTHTVKLVRASDGTDVSGSVTILSAPPGVSGGGYNWAQSGALLPPNTSYYLVSEETAGGDQWHDAGPVTGARAATIDGAVYGTAGQWTVSGGPNSTYVAPNFVYSLWPGVILSPGVPSVSQTTVAAGQTLDVTVWVVNYWGGITTPPTNTQLRLSTSSASQTAPFTVLADIATPPIAPDSSVRFTTTVTIPSNTPPRTYYIGAMADADNDTARDEESVKMYFYATKGPIQVTSTAPADTSPPTVSIAAPANGATVSGLLAVTAAAADNIAVTAVRFLVDGSVSGTLLQTLTSYTWWIDTTSLTKGFHTLIATASDAAGNTTTSAAAAIYVNNGGSAEPGFDVPFLRRGTPAPAVRNNYTGWAGFQFTVGPQPLLVYRLGRYYLPGNTGAHTLKLVRVSDGQDVAGTTVSIAMTQTPNASGFVYQPLPVGILLQANTSYFLVSYEAESGDQWYDSGPVTGTRAATIAGSVFGSAGSWTPFNPGSTSYVPLDFWYTLSPPAQLVAAPSLNAASIAAGAPVNVTVQTNNTGGGASTPTTTQITLNTSAASPQAAGYVVLGTIDTPAIPASGSVTLSKLFTIPAGTAPGSYYLWAQPDVGGESAIMDPLAAPHAVALQVTSAVPVVNSAAFVGTNTAAQGNWKGVFGLDGYLIANDSNNPAGYAAVAFNGAGVYTWAASSSDARAPLKGASSVDRIASAWYSGAFTIDLNLIDGQPHQVSLYCVDWDSTQRAQTVQILDAGTLAELDMRPVAGFNGGVYLTWTVKGHVVIQVTRTAGANAVVGGVFFK
jgi:hypothetical protein